MLPGMRSLWALLICVPTLAQSGELRRIPSPGGSHTLEYTVCFQPPDLCAANLRVLDSDGRAIQTLSTSHNRFERVLWSAPDRIGLVTKISPSAQEYTEIHALNGRESRHLFGVSFTPSPDSRWIAHRGLIIHFAPQFVKSETLEVDGVVLYPLPQGAAPMPRNSGHQAPNVVACRATQEDRFTEICTGLHAISPELLWSPGSRYIAILDRLYDIQHQWSSDFVSAGYVELRAQMYALIVALDGRYRRVQLPDTAREDIDRIKLEWSGAATLKVRHPEGDFTLLAP